MTLSQEQQDGGSDEIEVASAGISSGPDDPDRFFRDIDEMVKRWNHRADVDRRGDRENYLNGDVEFLFEYVGRGGSYGAEVFGQDIDAPYYVSFKLADSHQIHANREVGNYTTDNVAGKPCIVCRWDKELVFIDGIKLVNEIEEFIPARLTMGLQVDQRLEKAWGDSIGESILYGFIKPCSGFAKRELHFSDVSRCDGEWRDDFPVGMIQGSSEIVDGIAANERSRVNYGFVLFGKRGALAGSCICFENVGERALFAEKFVQLSDVFRGPINLESGAIHHERQASKAAQTGEGQKP